MDHNPKGHTEPRNSYLPLIIIFSLITLVSVASGFSIESGFDAHFFMRVFMAGFFLVFGAFKLMDLKGFKDGYQTYDLLAQKLPSYGYIYPFLELALGFAYVLDINPNSVNFLTIYLMGFSSFGVIQALIKKQKFTCACLGTVLKVPLTKITLAEDLLMVGMAVAMLFWPA